MTRINRIGALGAILATMSLTAGVPATAATKKHTNKGKHCVKYKKTKKGLKRCAKYSK